MIVINKTQCAVLKDICEKFDEHPVGEQIILVTVNEQKKSSSGIWLPEQEADRKVAHTPIYCGCVVAITEGHSSGLSKGDLIRFTPVSSEAFSSPNGDVQYLIAPAFEIKLQSHSIYSEDESMFIDPPPKKANVN